MLKTKEVEIQLNPSNTKYFESLGIEIPKWTDKKGRRVVKKGTTIIVNVENLLDGSNVLVDIECDGCGRELNNIKWTNYKRYVQQDGKYYCNKCAQNGYAKWINFVEWCYKNLSKELADIIIDRWDYDLNINKDGNVINPQDVSYASAGINGKGYWFKCLDYSKHKSEQKDIRHFTEGHKGSITCTQCNSISVTNPELKKFIVNIEDYYRHSNGSNKMIPVKCPDCGFEKHMLIQNLIKQGFGCSKCGDGVSFPNKFMFNVLDQLINLNKMKNFDTEKRFNWLVYEFKEKLRKGKLDFYFEINDNKYAVEMDGSFHSIDNNMNGQTAEESKFIDDEKDRLCEENNVKVIRIDSEKSELEFIKNNIINSSLVKILGFKESDIDWLKCHEYACSSLVKTVCDLWNDNIRSVLEIAHILKLAKGSIIKYLKQGTELEWCFPSYNPKEQININLEYIHEKNSIKIQCITTGEYFNSISEASKKYNINLSDMSDYCNTANKLAYLNLETNEKMVFMYYNEYLLNNKDQIKDIINNATIKKYRQQKIICLTTGEVFDSQKEASIKYSIDSSSISACCLNKRKSAGKHPTTNKKMEWTYV